MIRIFSSICILVFGMGLPLLAKSAGVDHPTPSTSSKAGSKIALPPHRTSVAEAKAQNARKEQVVVTPDISRGAVSPALAEKQEATARQEAAAVILAPEFQAPAHLEKSGPSVVIRSSTPVITSQGVTLRTATGPVMSDSDSTLHVGSAESRLARVTAYWAGEGDYYTGRGMSATGVRLHDGHCAVDPSIIPYGSVVEIAGVGKFLAVDTGSAVISRTAAREGGHTPEERHAIVVDLFFEDRSEGERFAAGDAKYITISWWTPTSMGEEARAARGLFAEEDWTKIQSKQL